MVEMKTPSVPTTFKSISDLIGDYLVELLTAYNQTSLADNAEAEPYVASLIRQGSFQDNPITNRISILVNPGNPEDTSNEPHLSDGISEIRPLSEIGIESREIGGGMRRYLHFTVEVKVYLSRTKEDRADARQIGLWVIGRAEQAIRENRNLDLLDDFGERALYMECGKSNKYEGGGKPNNFVWEGRLWVSALTATEETL